MATAELRTADPLRSIDEALAGLDEEQRMLDRRRAILETSRRKLLSTYDGDGALSVGKDLLAKVEMYLAENGRARQADIAADLGLNSGSVSVSLRKLANDGMIERAPKERGSQVWIYRNPDRDSTGAETQRNGKLAVR